jgi:cystathionine gamma-synthase
MKTGYPRFLIPRVVDLLAAQGLQRLADETGSSTENKRAMLFASHRHAALCQQVLCQSTRSPTDTSIFSMPWDGGVKQVDTQPSNLGKPIPGRESIYAVSFPTLMFPVAKSFWQHTGFGISSRRAASWLESTPFSPDGLITKSAHVSASPAEYDDAKIEIQRRISTGQSTKGLKVSEDDVFLFPTGMSAIAETAAAIQAVRGPRRDSACVAAVFGSVPLHAPHRLSNNCPDSCMSTPSKF